MLREWVLFCLLALNSSAWAQAPVTHVDNAQLKALVSQGVALYDVRRAEEWRQTGVVAGSRKLTFVDAAGRLNPDFAREFTAAVGRDTPVVLICRTGNRTGALARMLVEQLGYTKVYNVREGIVRWIRDGNPVVPG